MSREDAQLKIRLPAELKAEIEAAAKSAQRTMNAEIVARLQQSFEGGPGSEELRRELEHQRQLAEERARTIDSLEITRDMLAHFLSEVGNLAPEARQRPAVQRLVSFAESVLTRDVASAREIFSAMAGGKEEQGGLQVVLSSIVHSLHTAQQPGATRPKKKRSS